MKEIHDIAKESERAVIPKEKKEATYRLMVILFISASIMLFGGFISAIVVMNLSSFWVNFPMPSAFYWSTAIIILSSIFIYLTVPAAKKGKSSQVSAFLIITILMGVTFGALQFKGFGELISKNYMMAGQGIFYAQGAYGQDYVLTKNGNMIYFDGRDYIIEGDTLTTEQAAELEAFCYQICEEDHKLETRDLKIKDYGAPYAVSKVTDSETMSLEALSYNGKTLTKGELPITLDERQDLFYFSFGVYNQTPFFFVKGRYGEDFTITLEGEELSFVDRKLYHQSRKLTEEEIKKTEGRFVQNGKEFIVNKGEIYSEGQKVDASTIEDYFTTSVTREDIFINKGEWYLLGKEISYGLYNKFYQSSNNASSFLWVLVTFHLLHVILGLGALVVMFVRNKRGNYNEDNTVGLKMGGYFWHFLGIIWLVLFVFWNYVSL